MIEIFDSSCSRSLGQSASIRAAIDILNAPSAAGRPGMTPKRTRKKPIRNPVPDNVRS